jgi:two-component system cell cycle sensor histidine kinase/response regulator CckA
MRSPLRILHLEDDPTVAERARATLEANGIHCAATRVQNYADFLAALEEGEIDLVLSDSVVSGMDGPLAITNLRTRWPDVPIILVSRALGEEGVADSLKRGAADFVLKARLARLVPAVRTAVQEVEAAARRKRLEAQNFEAQKMEAIGQLAGGVAHDFNNILSVIVGYSSLIDSSFKPNSTLQKYTEEIRLASERAAGLTRQLLVFSRNQTVLSVVLDLNDTLKELEGMLRRLIDENIEMTIVRGTRLGRIKADSGYVGQVLMNLVANARDAMPSGGKLTIATENATLDANYASARPDAIVGDYVLLSVCDTGTGMTDQVKECLFDPFFTTKPSGKGTGLGLAICLNIVQQCGGHINVESELGRGTNFRIYFPRIEKPVNAVARALHDGPLPSGTETLLVVEDEPAIRNLARGVLEDRGFEVLCASNGQDGLHVASKHKGAPIRLVVTDVIMPLMSGEVMADQLKALDPNLRILFTSGYTDDAMIARRVTETGVDFLPKPYTSAALVRKVRHMLDGAVAPPQVAENVINGFSPSPSF